MKCDDEDGRMAKVEGDEGDDRNSRRTKFKDSAFAVLHIPWNREIKIDFVAFLTDSWMKRYWSSFQINFSLCQPPRKSSTRVRPQFLPSFSRSPFQSYFWMGTVLSARLTVKKARPLSARRPRPIETPRRKQIKTCELTRFWEYFGVSMIPWSAYNPGRTRSIGAIGEFTTKEGGPLLKTTEILGDWSGCLEDIDLSQKSRLRPCHGCYGKFEVPDEVFVQSECRARLVGHHSLGLSASQLVW